MSVNIVNSVLACVAIPFCLAAGYLLLLTLFSRRGGKVAAHPQHLRYCILVPAHNEERGIGQTIDSLQALDYPAERRRIVVVADNCTDATAEVAKSRGADVLQRKDPLRRGKGWALQYAIDRLLRDDQPEWDALVVIDADTTVAANLLTALSAKFEAGEVAVQAAYLPKDAAAGPIAVITKVAFAAFHLVRSSAREILGLSCGLRGNGMAFRRDLLHEVPHTAFSRSEDVEFGIRLGLRGVRIAFAAETLVSGDMPEHAEVVDRQRARWIGGRTELAIRYLPSLITGSLRERSWLLADLACDLLVPPLSLLTTIAAGGSVVSAAIAVYQAALTLPLILWALTVSALSVHVLHAAYFIGAEGAFLRSSGALPAYALGRAATCVRSLWANDDAWIRTTRPGETQ